MTTTEEKILMSIAKIEEALKHVSEKLDHFQSNSNQHFKEVKDLKDFVNTENDKRDEKIQSLCERISSLETMQKVLWFFVGGSVATGIGALVTAVFRAVSN